MESLSKVGGMTFRLLAVLCTFTSSVLADTTFDAALALVRAKRYPEARDALENVVKTSPANAEAWHELGLVWRRRQDDAAYEQAVACLDKAAKLAPTNPRFLADYGGTSLEFADRTRSISMARRGREAMEKAVLLDPNDLDAREGLYQFYARAPFFVGGSTSKAAEQLEAIRRRDPDRAVALQVLANAGAKKYADAFRLCDDELAKHPDNYTALYQYGRTASVSGQNLERGLDCLKKALMIDPPHPASPNHSHVWYRIADIQQKLGHPDEARTAYEAALKIDPGNRQASAALEKLR